MVKKTNTYSFQQVLKLAAKGEISTLKNLLKENPTLLNQKSEGHNRTLFWEAINANRVKMALFLIEQGANINIPGRYRNETFVLLQPYCIAIKKKKNLHRIFPEKRLLFSCYSIAYLGYTSTLKKLIKKSPKKLHEIQPVDTIWQTNLLHYAIAGQQIETAKFLIKAGISVEPHSELLYEIACRKNRFDLVILLTEAGGNPDAVSVFSVFYHHNILLIDYFFQHGLDPNKPNTMGWPPIVYISRGDKGEHPERVQTLLKYGADINAQTVKGVSALHAAAKAGFLAVVKILIAEGANVNLKDMKGLTAKDYAKKYNREQVVKFLS